MDTPLVLAIEDDSTLLSALKTKLEMNNFKVITSTDGEDGFKKAMDNQPSIILLDIMMPKMDGITLLGKIRNESWGKSIPVIILTNREADDEMVAKVVENQPSYFLIKADVSLDEIITKIKEVLKIS